MLTRVALVMNDPVPTVSTRQIFRNISCYNRNGIRRTMLALEILQKIPTWYYPPVIWMRRKIIVIWDKVIWCAWRQNQSCLIIVLKSPVFSDFISNLGCQMHNCIMYSSLFATGFRKEIYNSAHKIFACTIINHFVIHDFTLSISKGMLGKGYAYMVLHTPYDEIAVILCI